jgi:hypothetical protein
MKKMAIDAEAIKPIDMLFVVYTTKSRKHERENLWFYAVLLKRFFL